MGDLRLLRNDIIHNAGIACKQNSCRLSALKAWEEGATINYDEESVESIVRQVKREIDRFLISRNLPDPEHRKLWRVR